MYPSEVRGNAVMGDIARIFTDGVGPHLMVIFLVGAFAATYSTAFNYFDGWPRVVGACCRNLFRGTASLPRTNHEELSTQQRRIWYSEYNIYRASMFFSLFTSVAIIAGLPRPVYLVLIAFLNLIFRWFFLHLRLHPVALIAFYCIVALMLKYIGP